MEPDPQKIEAITAWAVPTDLAGVRKFLSLARLRTRRDRRCLLQGAATALASEFRRSKVCSCLLDRCRSFSVTKY